MNLVSVKSVLALEKEILKLPQVNMPVAHDFCNGLYARTMFIPANTVLTGAIHKDECFFVVRLGELIVTTDDEPVNVSTGFMSITKAGSKRAGVTLSDCIITTFHANPTNETSPDSIWENYTVSPETVKELLE